MVQFGEKPSTGTLFRASQFLSEELPIRLAHRVQELNDLPDGLNEMPSICRVRDWYAQSFEVGDGGLPFRVLWLTPTIGARPTPTTKPLLRNQRTTTEAVETQWQRSHLDGHSDTEPEYQARSISVGTEHQRPW